ncbi:hypothetical protein DPMN_061143 [Dreissena polymorpha]|uniref:Uncharacterized protein n=1 Tax=Dreissena polymorpha TaxID=45954 RepID=A0A9D4HGM3_DREPO|nr:hypothetical protein DPMN_061143 [Dreissena polymorpha]
MKAVLLNKVYDDTSDNCTDPDLRGPSGIHVTALGQVLVCGVQSTNLLQLDGAGKKKLATIATESDRLYGPLSVNFNRSTASIIVGTWHNYKILVFEVK